MTKARSKQQHRTLSRLEHVETSHDDDLIDIAICCLQVFKVSATPKTLLQKRTDELFIYFFDF